jgi:hypothetical protein
VSHVLLVFATSRRWRQPRASARAWDSRSGAHRLASLSLVVATLPSPMPNVTAPVSGRVWAGGPAAASEGSYPLGRLSSPGTQPDSDDDSAVNSLAAPRPPPPPSLSRKCRKVGSVGSVGR